MTPTQWAGKHENCVECYIPRNLFSGSIKHVKTERATQKGTSSDLCLIGSSLVAEHQLWKTAPCNWCWSQQCETCLMQIIPPQHRQKRMFPQHLARDATVILSQLPEPPSTLLALNASWMESSCRTSEEMPTTGCSPGSSSLDDRAQECA